MRDHLFSGSHDSIQKNKRQKIFFSGGLGKFFKIWTALTTVDNIVPFSLFHLLGRNSPLVSSCTYLLIILYLLQNVYRQLQPCVMPFSLIVLHIQIVSHNLSTSEYIVWLLYQERKREPLVTMLFWSQWTPWVFIFNSIYKFNLQMYVSNF